MRRRSGSFRHALARHRNERVVFWVRQGSGLLATVLILLAVVSIWFDDPARMALPFGMITAGLAFALHKVITSFAGYLRAGAPDAQPRPGASVALVTA